MPGPSCATGRSSSAAHGSSFAPALGLALLAACGPAAPGPVPEPAACRVGTAGAADTLRIALSGPVDPANAPSPQTDAERLAFAQLYETLLLADCEGTLRPGLAASWFRHDARLWTVTLRAGLRFWDGTPVTAQAVVQAIGRRGDEAAMLRDHGLSRAIAQNDSTLAVLLSRAQDDLRLLADPLFAVVRDTGGAWPLGTGTHAIVPSPLPPVVAVPVGVTSRDALPVLELMSPRDPRDAMDLGADLVITSDPTALEYARGSRSLETVPLPWDRTYVLLAPVPISEEPADLAAQVASAVRADARPAEPPFWWTAATRCDTDPGTRPTPVASTTARIAYARDDPTAMLLAQRLVALGAAGRLSGVLNGVPPGSRLVAVGMDPATFAGAVSTGREAGYVLPLPRQPLDPCVAHARVFHRSPWLYAADPAPHLVPLVDAREHVVLRRGRVSLRIGFDGTVYLVTP